MTKCMLEESCRHVDALYKSTSLPFTFTRVLLKVDDNEMSVEIQQIELLSCMAAALSLSLYSCYALFTDILNRKENMGLRHFFMRMKM